MAESVQVSYLHGQLAALQDAIASIWQANRGFIEGLSGGEDVDECIDRAMKLLPNDMTEQLGWVPCKLVKDEVAKPLADQWDDLL